MKKFAALLVGVLLTIAGQAHALMFSLDGKLSGNTFTAGGPFGYVNLVDNGNDIDATVFLSTSQTVRTLSLNYIGSLAGVWSATGGNIGVNTISVISNGTGYNSFFDIRVDDTSLPYGNPLTFKLSNTVTDLDTSMFNTSNAFSTPLYAAVRTFAGQPPEGDFYGASSVVPEPGTMVLLGAGLLGLAVFGKRRMKA